MSSPPTLDAIAKWFSTLVISSGGVAAFLYFLLKKTLEKTVDSRFDARLEKVKHELQLEQQKMSIVYEQQKDSFRKVLVAMNNASAAIAANVIGEGDEWPPITEAETNAFSRVFSEESLFMDSRSDHALRLFREIMWTAVRYEQNYPSSDKVWRAYGEMNYVSERLAEYFRIRVGLETGTRDPLLDAELLGACREINKYNFADFDLPTKGPLQYQDNSSPARMVALVREDPRLLKSELARLRAALLKHSPIFFENLTRVDWYIGKVESL